MELIKENYAFYCAINLHEVPKDAVGKEWEFSDNGRNWVCATLVNIEKGVAFAFRTKKDKRAVSYLFMREI